MGQPTPFGCPYTPATQAATARGCQRTLEDDLNDVLKRPMVVGLNDAVRRNKISGLRPQQPTPVSGAVYPAVARHGSG